MNLFHIEYVCHKGLSEMDVLGATQEDAMRNLKQHFLDKYGEEITIKSCTFLG